MNTTLILENLLAWSLQATLLIAVAALVSLRWNHARAKLIFWQGVLAIVVLLPVTVPWRQPPPEALANSSIAVTQGPLLPVDAGRSLIAQICNLDSILWLIGAGALLRFLWIAAGMLRLRCMRLQAESIQARGLFRDHGVRWYSSEEIAGPVTFGWWRPCVLLPARVALLPDAVQEAIACHELLHIERRDWLFVLAEEVIRGALWFHPAVWFALARIQLAREQAVDEEVVRRTSDREGYVDALLAVAGHRLEPDVAPAPLFLKKNHLAARVTAVVHEASVSKIESLLRFASAGFAALAAVLLAVWMFPFESQAQALPDDSGITCDAGAALLHRPPLRYPSSTTAGGLVLLDATVNANGQVTDARVLSGPEELRKAALQNVLQWNYSASSALTSARIAIQFAPRGSASSAQRPSQAAPPAPRPSPVPAPPSEPVPTPVPAADPPRLSVGGSLQSANLIVKIPPAYPLAAKQAHVQGKVSLAVTIGKDGAVLSVEVISGDSVLAEAAVDAVKQWVYRPTLLNGEPIEVTTQVDVNFTLSQ